MECLGDGGAQREPRKMPKDNSPPVPYYQYPLVGWSLHAATKAGPIVGDSLGMGYVSMVEKGTIGQDGGGCFGCRYERAQIVRCRWCSLVRKK